MLTIRRLYLYGVSAIALALMAVGAGSLIELAFERLGRAIAGTGVIGPGLDRELLAMSVALLIVGLPLWLAHWWLADRSVRRDTPEADAERRSVIRALYLAGVAAVALGYLAAGGVAFVETLIRAPSRSRLRRSRPSWSVPRMCPAVSGGSGPPSPAKTACRSW